MGDSNVGPNFDVVAHFTHSFCISKWTKEEMQMVGDWGSNGTPGSEDYPLGGGVDDNHAHTDTVDKRFADDLNVGGVAKNNKYTCVDAGTCDNTAGMQLGGTGDIVRWPNAGAFAGFYSFVACANVVTANRRLSARWNVRQAGSNIRNCGPG